MHQAYVKTICKEKLIHTATLPKIAASTTVDWQDSADGGVWVSQRVRGRGPCVHWLQGEGGGGGYTVAEDWTTERGVGDALTISFLHLLQNCSYQRGLFCGIYMYHNLELFPEFI